MADVTACGMVVYRKEAGNLQFLLVKSRAFGHWGFPKGHQEEGETTIQTAIRELFEETSLKVEVDGTFETKEEYTTPCHKRKQVIYYIGEAKTSNVMIQEEEISDFYWGSFEDVNTLLTYDNTKQVLIKAYQYLKKNNE